MEKEQINRIIFYGKPSHHEEGKDNLGFGWIYYGLVRIYKPDTVVSIGSGCGFVPMCLAQGCEDNNKGMVYFVDPSVGGTSEWAASWQTPEKVKERFDTVKLTHRITHYKEFNYEFIKHWNQTIDLLFIDGSDSEKNVRMDFFDIGKFVRKNGFILIHDTSHTEPAYYEWKLVFQLKSDPNYDVIRFPGFAGFSIIRKLI